MAFHVELRHGLQRARAFNLSESDLRARVLDPWRARRPVELGDQVWEPAEAELRVLEGPQLAASELQFGRGWSRAERTARDVTAALLAAAGPVALLAASEAAAAAGAAALERAGRPAVEWAPVRAAILAGERSLPPVLVMADTGAAAAFWLDAGLAVGALGARALLRTAGAAPPAGIPAVPLDPADDALRNL